MQLAELNKMQLTPMSDADLLDVNGGGWWERVVRGTFLYEVYKGVTDNWDEIKVKFMQGWNIDKK